MTGNEARAAAPARQDATAAYGAAESLGWDGAGAVLALLLAATPARNWVSPDSLVPEVFRALWWLIYVAAAARLLREFGAQWLRWTIRYQPALCLLLILSAASTPWSLDPASTLRKAASLLGTTLVAVWIGYANSPQRLMRVLCWTFTLLILSNVVAAVLLPPPLADVRLLGWRGLMGHRNSLGAAAALATILFLIAMLRRQVHPWWGATLCALSILALAEALCRTALVALSVCLVTWLSVAIVSITRQSIGGLLRGLSLALVLAVAIAPYAVGPVAAALGNSDPLNGRTAIWAGVVTMLQERPLTGYGYAVVWGRGDATLLPAIHITAHPSATTAHNSIANVASELGIPAAIVACAYLFGALFSAGRLYEQAPSAFSLTALMFLMAITIMGFAEAHLLQIHWVFWILFVAVAVAVRRAASDAPAAICGEAER